MMRIYTQTHVNEAITINFYLLSPNHSLHRPAPRPAVAVAELFGLVQGREANLLRRQRLVGEGRLQCGEVMGSNGHLSWCCHWDGHLAAGMVVGWWFLP